MFKKIFPAGAARRDRPRNSTIFVRRLCRAIRLGTLALALLLSAFTGCRTTPLLPKADLSEPGWKTYDGQAIWRAKRGAPEIAGEILLATNNASRSFVQFTKTPFPFVIAQSSNNVWQIESPTQNRTYAGHGQPPARIIWLQLPRAFAGAPLTKPWSWKITDDDWRLENSSSGEMLHGYFNAAKP